MKGFDTFLLAGILTGITVCLCWLFYTLGKMYGKQEGLKEGLEYHRKRLGVGL